MSRQADPSASFREYYDQNTGLFSWLGSSAKTLSIHRALWPPGVTTRQQALEQSNRLVWDAFPRADEPGQSTPLNFADLGCGIGGTLIYLLKHLSPAAFGLGLTISPLQARLASHHLQQAGVALYGSILEGDFHCLPLKAGLDVLVAIEAFAHASRPREVLVEAARVLRPGGRFVLVDDFLAASQIPADPQLQRWLQAFRKGWRVPGLSPLTEIHMMAANCGLHLVKDQHLTPWLHLHTLPSPLTDLILAAGERLPVRHAIIPSMLGSLALQHCLQAGLVEYHLLVYEKQPRWTK